jgi:hypothetical protein
VTINDWSPDNFADVEVLEIIPDTETGLFLVRIWASRDDQARLLPPDSSATDERLERAIREALLGYHLLKAEGVR